MSFALSNENKSELAIVLDIYHQLFSTVKETLYFVTACSKKNVIIPLVW